MTNNRLFSFKDCHVSDIAKQPQREPEEIVRDLRERLCQVNDLITEAQKSGIQIEINQSTVMMGGHTTHRIQLSAKATITRVL